MMETQRSSGSVRRSRRLARLLDSWIRVPGTSWRFGLDPILGLIPGSGDWMGWALSLYLMGTAVRVGADGATLVRMAGNLIPDAVVGVVPILGDLFDAGFKANQRNLELLEQVLARPEETRRASRWVVAGIFGGTLTALSAAAWGAYQMVRFLVLMVL